MISHYFDSHRGGIELVAGALSRGLAQRQCEVTWAAANVSPAPVEFTNRIALPLKASNLLEKLSGLPFPLPGVSALRKLFGAVKQADIVVLHDCLYIANLAAFLRARMLGIPVVIVQHIGAIPYRSTLLAAVFRLATALITRPLLSSGDQVIFIGKTTQRHFASVHFRNPPKLVYNGVDTQTFRPIDESELKESARDVFGLPRERPVALFVGRFVEKKGVSVMKRLTELSPGLCWAFAGWGPLDPSNWKMPNVRVFSGLMGASLAALYRACDIFVLPSTGEGFPLVIQEALACGLPIVCGTETASADERLHEVVHGAPIYPGDDDRTAREFLAAIDGLLSSEAVSATKGDERRAFAMSRYSWAHATDQYIEIASRLVEQSQKGELSTVVRGLK